MSAATSSSPASLTTPLLSQRLKTETSDLHTRVERHPSQAAMVTARVGTAGYGAYLSQLLHVHEALDHAAPLLAATNASFARVWRAWHARAANARADLGTLGMPQDGPSAPTQQFAAHIAQLGASGSLALLGVLYVLEGSANGGVFIAKALSRCLPAEAGTTYLNPHGEQQRERWAEFKRCTDELNLSAGDQDLIVQEARATFIAIERIFDALPVSW